MTEQPKHRDYDATLERAKIHLIAAYEQFKADAAIRWDEMTGNVPKVREQVWVDALKETIVHHERIERLLS
jgi:hypothetical protein